MRTRTSCGASGRVAPPGASAGVVATSCRAPVSRSVRAVAARTPAPERRPHRRLVRRRWTHRLRDGFLALVTLAVTVGVVALVLREDPASRAALVELLGPVLDDVRFRLAAVGIDVA